MPTSTTPPPILFCPPSWPVGAIFLTIDPTDPATTLGYGTWQAFGTGRVLVAIDTSNPNFATVEQTGGALSIAAAGSNSAPAFTGVSANTSLVSAGTPGGTVAAPVFTGTPFSTIINHTHTITSTLTVQGGTTAATTGTHVMTSTATGGSARAVTAGDSIASSSANPTGGAASITPAGTNTAPAFTGNALATHQHTLTASGTVAAPTFAGSPTSVVQPYIVVYMWKRVA